ncbi:MAG: hypothetical protein V7731_20960 [Amphritea sp.]
MVVDKKQIRSDRWLQVMMRTGVPVAAVSIIFLWLGHLLEKPSLGNVFLVTLPIALVIGFAYNVRYVMLAVRAKRKESDSNPSDE